MRTIATILSSLLLLTASANADGKSGDAAILWGPRGWGAAVSTPAGWVIDEKVDHSVAEAVIRPAHEPDGKVIILLSTRPAAVAKDGKPVPLAEYLRQSRADYRTQHAEVEITDDSVPTSSGQKTVAFRLASSRGVFEMVWLEDPSGYTRFELSAPDAAHFANALPVLRSVVGGFIWMKSDKK